MSLKFHLGFPDPDDPVSRGVDHWMVVRGSEGRNWSAERVLVLLGCSMGIAYCIALLWYAIAGRWLLYLPSFPVSAGVVALSLVAHEAIHFLALPKSMEERGLGVFAGGAFVSIRGMMTRNRALVVLLAPLAILSGGPLIWNAVIGPVDDRIVFASIWNGAGSIFDLLASYSLFRQVPAAAALHFGTGAIRFQVAGSAGVDRAP
jgi:hypothetical protein